VLDMQSGAVDEVEVNGEAVPTPIPRKANSAS
jgi:hypothetical protein